MQQLTETMRGDLREFAFYIGNGTLNYMADDAEEFDYDHLLNTPSDLLGMLFTIYMNNVIAVLRGETDHLPHHRAAQYVAIQCLPTYTMSPPLAAWEYVPHPVTSLAGAVSTFASDLGNGRVLPEVLAPTTYLSIIVEYGSFLEQIFAIFSNLLTVDRTGQVGNYAHAQLRAAQYIRQYCDHTYHVDPPFEAWETELV